MIAAPEERVCLDSRPHGIVLARPFACAVALAGAGGFLLLRPWPLPLAGAPLVAVAALLALRAVWRWDRTRVVVTTEKVYVVHGILRRRAAAVRLRSIDALELEQTLPGRVLGYGTLVAGPLEISHVPEPRRVYGLVERLCA